MNGLDLFSGIGGLSLALHDWVTTITYCERDTYAQAVLLSRMHTGDIDRAPIWDDITSLNGTMLPSVDIIFGGFPCQDISVAGTGAGLDGQRSGLYWHMHRLIAEIKPAFVFLENVPAIRTRGLERVVGSLTELGYDCRWTTVSAAEVGACHIRKRWFLLAYADSVRLWQKQWAQLERSNQVARPLEPDSQSSPRGIARPSKWSPKPRVDRASDGLSHIVDRNRCLGNAVVPQQAKEAFMRLIGVKCATS